MQRIDANTSRDFSRFDMLSTDELRQIIRQDSLLNENESANVEAILYISKLLSDRELADRPRDVSAAWESFQKDYLPYSDDPEPLYALDEEVSERQAEKKKRTRILIPAAVLVAAILLLFAVWMYSSKMKASTDQAEVSLFPELSAALSACDVKEAVVPKWLPKKYEGEDLKIIETPEGWHFHDFCGTNTDFIVIQIEQFKGEPLGHRVYETDPGDPVIYVAGGIEHYLVTNHAQRLAIWRTEDMECCIRGEISERDMKRIVDSIYE